MHRRIDLGHVEDHVVFEVHLLGEVGRAEVTLELLLACVLLHVPGHVLGGDALAAYGTLGAHLRFWD